MLLALRAESYESVPDPVPTCQRSDRGDRRVMSPDKSPEERCIGGLSNGRALLDMAHQGDGDKDKGMGTEKETRLRESDRTDHKPSTVRESGREGKALDDRPPPKKDQDRDR